MRGVRLAALSQFLLELYATSHRFDASSYSRLVLEGTCELLDAEKGWWGTIAVSDAGPRLLSSYTFGLSPRWEAAWQSVRGDDSIAQAIARTKNRTVMLDSAALPPSSKLVRLADGFDIGQTLSVSSDLLDQDAFMFVSIYRSHGRPLFTSEDRMVNELLIPHVQAAWNHNLRASLAADDQQRPANRYKAFVDLEGRTIQQDTAFAEAISRHWPAWRGTFLPNRLRDAIKRSREVPGMWVGRDEWNIRATAAGPLTLIELREVTALDRLTKRELQVAELFARGHTHKVIARSIGLSPSTVRFYLREVYWKLGIDNKAALGWVLRGRTD